MNADSKSESPVTSHQSLATHAFWFVMGMIAGILTLWTMVRPTLDGQQAAILRLSGQVQACAARQAQGVDLFHGLLRLEPGPAIQPAQPPR
jgi:hypothetical protein